MEIKEVEFNIPEKYKNIIKSRTLESLRLYVEYRIEPGDFLFSVLSNDLIRSWYTADPDNLQSLGYIIELIDNEIPLKCWGSKQKVINWLGGTE